MQANSFVRKILTTCYLDSNIVQYFLESIGLSWGWKTISTREECLAKENQMSDADTDLFNKQETTLLQLNYMLAVGSQVKYWFIFLETIIYQGCEVVGLFLSWAQELLIDPTKMVVVFFILQSLLHNQHRPAKYFIFLLKLFNLFPFVVSCVVPMLGLRASCSIALRCSFQMLTALYIFPYNNLQIAKAILFTCAGAFVGLEKTIQKGYLSNSTNFMKHFQVK